MKQVSSRLPNLLIIVGSCLFIFALWLSAYLEPDIRWLHFCQAWMYLATIALTLAGNRWGYFIGASAAAFWNYVTMFVNTFLKSGLHWLGAWISTGHLERLDQVVAVPAWVGNLLVLVGCVWSYIQISDKRSRDIGAATLSFALTTAFFAMAMAVCQPRYLPLFRAALHPHLPW
jgi:hypothetical protein